MSALAGLLAYVRREALIIREECLADGLTPLECTPLACAAMVVRELRNADTHHSSDGSDPEGLPRADCGCQTCRSLFPVS